MSAEAQSALAHAATDQIDIAEGERQGYDKATASRSARALPRLAALERRSPWMKKPRDCGATHGGDADGSGI